MSTEPASDEIQHLRRSAARKTILAAARQLIESASLSELSLSAVAAEAGLGPSTVFGHFRNKDELVLAILADDLAQLAGAMHDSLPVPQITVHPSEPAVVSGQASGSPATSPACTDPLPLEAPGNVIPLRADAAPSPPVNGADGGQESGNPDRPRVDAWLERRLRVFEHALADVEKRLAESEAASARSVLLAEDGVENLSGRMEAFERRQRESAETLTQRVEDVERRQRGATAELRAAINDAATRIEILESARRAEPPSSFGRRAPDLVASAAFTAETPAEPQEEEAALDSDGYKVAALRAASAAAALAEIEPAAQREPLGLHSFVTRRIRFSRRQYIIGLLAGLLAFVFGALAAFSIGQARGREMALAARVSVPRISSKTHSRSMPMRPSRTAAKAADPSDRLSVLASAGNPVAELLTGLRLLRGEGAAPDHPKAAEWIRRAAEQRDPRAEYWLATLYETGDGVRADAAEAVRWYEAAAAQGNSKAMHALGVAYAQGTGTQKDYSAAARWFSRGAGLGLVNSEFNLGVLYERGLGVPQSLADAYKWYAIAATQGDEESRTRVEALKTQLTADELAAAKRAAQMFQPRAVDRRANEPPSLAALLKLPGRP